MNSSDFIDEDESGYVSGADRGYKQKYDGTLLPPSVASEMKQGHFIILTMMAYFYAECPPTPTCIKT